MQLARLDGNNPSRLNLLESGATVFRIDGGQPFDARRVGNSFVRRVDARASRDGLLFPFMMRRAGWGAPSRTEEVQPLIGEQMNGGGTSAGQGKDMTYLVLTVTLVFVGTSLWLGVIAVLAAAYLQVTKNINGMHTAVQPYVVAAVNHSMSILRHIDAAAVNAASVTNGAEQISTRAVPAIQHALNQSNAMMQRLEALMANPVVHVSLGGQTATAG